MKTKLIYKNFCCECHDKKVDGAESLFQELIDEGKSHWIDKTGGKREVSVADIELMFADEIEKGMPIIAAITEYIDAVIDEING